MKSCGRVTAGDPTCLLNGLKVTYLARRSESRHRKLKTTEHSQRTSSQETQLSQRDRATRHVSGNLVSCCTVV